MSAIYSFGISLYALGVKLAGLRNPKARKMIRGRRESLDLLQASISPTDRVVWVHAASLGEFEQGRPLMEHIRAHHPEFKILLTFFSPSGYEVRKNWNGADCICYLPFDTPGRVRSFLDAAHPEMAFFVKYEIWGNFLSELHRRNISTYLISSVFRPGQVYFKSWGKEPRRWLGYFTRIFVQDERSRSLLAGIGIADATVAGDTRFDRVAQIRDSQHKIPEIERFLAGNGHAMTLMAGSSWPEDEAVYLDWVCAHPEVKVVIAPHEFDASRLARLKEKCRNGAILMSECTQSGELPEAQVLIIDCFGLLSSAYAYCDVAYVGGGFGAGLHNINEAAVYDVPVVYGPNNHKFIEAREMAAAGGGFPVDGAAGFKDVADSLLHNPERRTEAGNAAGKYIRSKLGATAKILSYLNL